MKPPDLGGRPTLYDPSFPEQVRSLARLGLPVTTKQLAFFFGASGNFAFATLKHPLRAASAGVDWIGIVAPAKRPVTAKTKNTFFQIHNLTPFF
jgi:hypothetical protein